MKRKLHKAWQTFLVISFAMAIIGTIFWACCIDSESYIPTIMLAINAFWVFWMTICNEPARSEKERTNGISNKHD